MSDPFLTIRPRPVSWWTRWRCRLWIHQWKLLVVPVSVLDGVVDMPDGFQCESCQHIWRSSYHRIRAHTLCFCRTCRMVRESPDPRLGAYRKLRLYGTGYNPAVLVAIHPETIENHPLYLQHEHNRAHERYGIL